MEMKLPVMNPAALRAAAILVGKVIGLVGRATLTRILGAEGVGLYQIAYSCYGIFLMIITGGLPTALALFTAKHPAKGWGAFRTLSVIVALAGAAASLLMYMQSDSIAILLGNPDVEAAIRCLAPALLAVPLLQLLRGYMQGSERYGAISFSEIAEQAVRIGTMIVLVLLFASEGTSIALGAGLTGTTIGALAAFLLLTACLAIRRSFPAGSLEPHPPLRGQVRSIVHASMAIGFTRLLMPASDFIDSLLIPRRLQSAGYTLSEATSIYGVITGMAVIVAYMPTIVTGAISYTMTMKLASDYQQGELRSYQLMVRRILQLCWTWGLLSGMFLLLFADPLAHWLFHTPEAADPIRYFAVLPLVVGLRELTTSILWTQERKNVPFMGLLNGIAFSTALLFFLLAIPGFGYEAASIGILALEGIAVLINLYALHRMQAKLFAWRWITWEVVFCVLSLFWFLFALPPDPESASFWQAAGHMLIYMLGAGSVLLVRAKSLMQ
ncbi:oligosaccharide flippase family protein [Paenibacillus thiaminolyticus]|uniref:oligosaccharide flippase family protein n=1 Tax=Paenibacillus thiaminolyticus TaxID=49283 RepID=UPI001F0FF936|nr:oligosaccharide flippase family protein [Paenibacillus thiaminolyticus]